MLIREEQPADHAAVAAVIEAAFEGSDEAELVARLRADGSYEIALVAVVEGGIVGHVMFSPMTAPFRALGLAPLAVASAYQGHGVGSRLVNEGLERARARRWEGVFVLGDPAYYRRFGFDPGLAKGFASVYAGPHLMAMALGGELPASSGEVRYASAFAG